MNIKVLNYSLRDGSYHNKWDFTDALVYKYLHAVNAANVDIIELL